MLRTDIDDIVVFCKQTVLLAYEFAIFQRILATIFRFHIIDKGVAVVKLPILAERITFEVVTQEQTAHIGMTEELDAVEVKDLTLQDIGNLPQLADSRNNMFNSCIGSAYLTGNRLHGSTLVGIGILQNIDTTQTFLTKVLTNDGNEVIEMLFLLQLLHLLCKAVKFEYLIL